MSEIVKLRPRTDIEEEAAQWTWRLDDEAFTAADRQAFEAWLHQDARHRRVFEEMSKVWSALDGFVGENRSEMITAVGSASPPARGAPASWRMGAAAAAVLVLVAAGFWWLRQGKEIQTLATAVGQQRNVTLVDGSIVTLNTNTIVEIDLSRSLRQIYLRKGEAHFQVAHDRSRPFLVHAGDAVVRAVGTEFEVRLRSDQHVDIMVNEGRVEVQATTPARAPQASGVAIQAATRALAAGEELSTASAGYAVQRVSPAQLSSEMAWREGAIIFDGQPLAQAITEIERYTDARIVVTDPEVAALRVGGRFRTDDVPGFFQGLEAALPVSVRRTPDGAVYVEPRH
jgi:transmembrane sensor